MARIFHLSCLGPVAPDFDRKEMAPRLAKLLGNADTARKAMDASPVAPVPITIPTTTLDAARALDHELLNLGIMSLVCYVDSSLPEANRVYIDQRKGSRRAEAKTGVDALPPKAVKVSSANDLRATRGRRKQDKL